MNTAPDASYERVREVVSRVAAGFAARHDGRQSDLIRGAYAVIVDNLAREAPDALARVLDDLAERYPHQPNG